MDMNSGWIAFGSAIAGAIIGGIIAGFFALRATTKSFENQQQHSRDSEDKLIQGLLQAIHDELETVYERYQDTMGSRVDSLDDGKPLLFYYPVVNDYFSVYNGNTFLIGRIPSNDLRKQIVKTYTVCKGLVDSFRLNNDLVQKYEHSQKVFDETQQPVHQNHAAAHFNTLVEYAKSIKQSHQMVKQDVGNLLRTLRKEGVLNEKAK